MIGHGPTSTRVLELVTPTSLTRKDKEGQLAFRTTHGHGYLGKRESSSFQEENLESPGQTFTVRASPANLNLLIYSSQDFYRYSSLDGKC